MGIFGVFAVAMMTIATRVLLPQRPAADPVMPWFLGFMWVGALVPVFFTIYHAWKALRHGRSTLYLDAPPRIGSWISGQVSAPARFTVGKSFCTWSASRRLAVSTAAVFRSSCSGERRS